MFVHCYVTQLLNWPIISPFAGKEKAGFLEIYVLRTSSCILRLTYKCNKFLTMFSADDQSGSSALILVMLSVHLC